MIPLLRLSSAALFLWTVSLTVCNQVQAQAYEQDVGASHLHGHHGPRHGGWGGQTAGSYYHYHVPLVGQGQGWGWEAQGHSGDKGNHALLALGLLLGLAALSALLLPLLLIPLGLSLLALLGGGGGMMMMMAMMMMMMMMMPQPNARTENVGRAIVDSMGKLVTGDVSGAMGQLASTIDLDKCPEALLCTGGAKLMDNSGAISQLPLNINSRALFTFLQKSGFMGVKSGKKFRKALRRYEGAFWHGVTSRNCDVYQCNVFREDSSSSVNTSVVLEGQGQGVDSYQSLNSTVLYSTAEGEGGLMPPTTTEHYTMK